MIPITRAVLWAIAAFAAGVGVGLLLSGFFRERMSYLRRGVAVIVIIVWLGFNIRSLMSADFTVPLALHGLAGTVVGWVFGEDLYSRRQAAKTQKRRKTDKEG